MEESALHSIIFNYKNSKNDGNTEKRNNIVFPLHYGFFYISIAQIVIIIFSLFHELLNNYKMKIT